MESLSPSGSGATKRKPAAKKKLTARNVKQQKWTPPPGNLSNIELDHMLSSVPNYKGTYMKDELYKLPVDDIRIAKNRKSPVSFIVNLDRSSGGGTHWVAVVIDFKLPYAEYFDSYGLQPPIEVMDFIKNYTVKQGMYKPTKFSEEQIQMDKSDLCGYYCAYYISERTKHMPDTILDRFTSPPTIRNEQIVSQYFS